MTWALIAGITVVAIVAVIIVLGARAPSFEVTPEGLRIQGSLYGRLIPASELNLDQARIVDLSATPELRPKWRTNGIGLPGYQAGWFRLNNKEKALLFLNRSRALYIPTKSGYSLLISPEDPEGLITALRSAKR
jgi:hypothetical protein